MIFRLRCEMSSTLRAIHCTRSLLFCFHFLNEPTPSCFMINLLYLCHSDLIIILILLVDYPAAARSPEILQQSSVLSFPDRHHGNASDPRPPRLNWSANAHPVLKISRKRRRDEHERLRRYKYNKNTPVSSPRSRNLLTQ